MSADKSKSKSPGKSKSAAQKGREARSGAEWVTFAISLAILLGVAALILFQVGDTSGPALPTVVKTGPVEQSKGKWLVPVEVRNEGGETAESVQVTASFEAGGETIEADQEVEFLAKGESAEVVFVFDQDPAGGKLDVRVAGYASP